MNYKYIVLMCYKDTHIAVRFVLVIVLHLDQEYFREYTIIEWRYQKCYMYSIVCLTNWI